MRNKALLPIFLVVFVDLLGFGLILPLLPFYAETYGATPVIVGLLTASYAAAQLIGAPILGRLSDRFGRRPVLLVSIFGTLIGFLFLGLAEPLGSRLAGILNLIDSRNAFIIGFLFFSRILDGLTGGNISVAQAYISDITSGADRAKGLGLIGAAFGLGFIFGPALGGLLSAWGYATPAFTAAGLASLNLVAVYFRLPESLTARARSLYLSRPRPEFSVPALWQALNRPRVGPLLHIRFFFGLAFAMFQSIFALFAQYRLGLDARGTGFVLTYVGVLAALVQGVGVGRLAARYSEKNLIFSFIAIMSVSMIGWALTPNVWVMLVVLAPIALSGGVLNTILSSSLTKVVRSEEVGGTLGLAASVESLTRVIAPSVGGFLIGSLGTWAPGIASALILSWAATFAWRRLIVNPDPPLPDLVEIS
jgi:DHA1 family tetracycline resistance protein-like MFS transporter